MSADKMTRLAIGCRCLPKCLHYPHYPVMSASVSFDRDLERREAARRFLVERIDYERTQSMPCSEEAFKLDRMRELLRRLGDPQRGHADRPRRRHQGKGLDVGDDGGRALGGRLSDRPVHFAPSRSGRRAHGHRRPALFGRGIRRTGRAGSAGGRSDGSRGGCPNGTSLPEHLARPISRSSRRRPCATSPAGAWTRPCWKWGWAAGSIRPTSARRASRSSPASASTTPSSWARRWRRSPPRKPASSSPACRSSAA